MESSVTHDLYALGRIISTIKTYRRQTGDCQDLTQDESLNKYMKNHLSISDFSYWQRLQVDAQATMGINGQACA